MERVKRLSRRRVKIEASTARPPHKQQKERVSIFRLSICQIVDQKGEQKNKAESESSKIESQSQVERANYQRY